MADPRLGPLLSAARNKAGLTQAQLGELLIDLPDSRRNLPSMISSIERGDPPVAAVGVARRGEGTGAHRRRLSRAR